MSFTIEIREGLLSEWATADPILSRGELGWAWDDDARLAGSLYVGDGDHHWSDLTPYAPGGDGGGGEFPTVPTQTIVGRNVAGTGPASALAPATVRTILQLGSAALAEAGDFAPASTTAAAAAAQSTADDAATAAAAAQTSADDAAVAVDVVGGALGDHLSDANDSHDASAISLNPAGLAIVTATNTQAAVAELDAALDGHLDDSTDSHDATAISVNPSGLIVVTTTNVQAALAELDAVAAAAAVAADLPTTEIDDLADRPAGSTRNPYSRFVAQDESYIEYVLDDADTWHQVGPLGWGPAVKAGEWYKPPTPLTSSGTVTQVNRDDTLANWKASYSTVPMIGATQYPTAAPASFKDVLYVRRVWLPPCTIDAMGCRVQIAQGTAGSSHVFSLYDDDGDRVGWPGHLFASGSVAADSGGAAVFRAASVGPYQHPGGWICFGYVHQGGSGAGPYLFAEAGGPEFPDWDSSGLPGSHLSIPFIFKTGTSGALPDSTSWATSGATSATGPRIFAHIASVP